MNTTENAAALKAAIRAITVDLPDDEPNGIAERMLVAIGDFTSDWKPIMAVDDAKLRALCGLFAEMCEANADDTRALRLAADAFFGEDFTKPAAPPLAPVPRGHCNRCGRCGFTLAESMETGCIPGNCSFRTDDPTWKPRTTCAGCGAPFAEEG